MNFLNDESKIKLLKKANNALRINNNNNNIIFVYTPPKVGSTSLVTSFRIFFSNKYSIIHIHDEEMLRVLGNVEGVTINEIILYNKSLNKNVYVIDIYRSPIERKISAYFEKIGPYHFNNKDENINSYNVDKIINRFNKIFPYIGIGDHYMDKYCINLPEKFDHNNKYMIIEENDIKYIKLRLKDSEIWGNILTKIFGTEIIIVKDYETSNKIIKPAYENFKKNYKIPSNFLEDIRNCKYLNYYYSEDEMNEYVSLWLNKITQSFIPFSENEYKLYEEISLENNHIDEIQVEHYLDQGCTCKGCNIKRQLIIKKIKNNFYKGEKIIHEEVKHEIFNKISIRFKNIASFNNGPKRSKRDFNVDMKTVVSSKR